MSVWEVENISSLQRNFEKQILMRERWQKLSLQPYVSLYILSLQCYSLLIYQIAKWQGVIVGSETEAEAT